MFINGYFGKEDCLLDVIQKKDIITSFKNLLINRGWHVGVQHGKFTATPQVDWFASWHFVGDNVSDDSCYLLHLKFEHEGSCYWH